MTFKVKANILMGYSRVKPLQLGKVLYFSESICKVKLNAKKFTHTHTHMITG